MHRNLITAVVVAEVFDARDARHPLYPITQSPVALAPIANTCLIDYILENLLRNGIQRVYVLNNTATYGEVGMHLANVKNGRGKSWFESTEMKVVHIASRKVMGNVFDASLSIVEQNLIGEHESFIWIPIDVVSNVPNLKDVFQKHRQRADLVNSEGSLKYAATMVTSKENSLLFSDVHNAVATRATTTRPKESASAFPVTPVTPQFNPAAFSSSFATDVLPHKLLHCAMSVSFDERTEVVKTIQRWEGDDGSNLCRFPLHQLKKSRLALRTDLSYTGVMILSPGALSLFKFFMKETFDFFTGILNMEETELNCFGIEIAPKGTTVLPVNSLQGFVAANVAVSMRRLYPMTKESNFADGNMEYSVAHYSPSVCLHRTCKTGVIGPHVVVGGETLVPASAKISRSTIGSHCSFGDGVIIEDSVVMDYVHIDDKCVIRDSVICSSVHLPREVYITGCILGKGVVVQAAQLNFGIQLDNLRIEACLPATMSNAPSGVIGQIVPAPASSVGGSAVRALPPMELFTHDNTVLRRDVDAEDDEEEVESEGDNDKSFYEAVQTTVVSALRSPSRVDNTTYALQDVRTSHRKVNGDVARVVAELIIGHVATQYKDSTSTEAFNAVSDILSLWCIPFFKPFVLTDADMAKVLAGVAVALNGLGKSLLFPKSAKIFELLFCKCNPVLFDERGWCIVTGEALLAFDSLSEKYESVDAADRTPEQTAIVEVGQRCISYMDSVREFLEE